jgi:hypothetical protein
VGVTHLFQYYVYTVYSFFGKEKEDPDASGNNGIVSTMSMVAAGTSHHLLQRPAPYCNRV